MGKKIVLNVARIGQRKKDSIKIDNDINAWNVENNFKAHGEKQSYKVYYYMNISSNDKRLGS